VKKLLGRLPWSNNACIVLCASAAAAFGLPSVTDEMVATLMQLVEADPIFQLETAGAQQDAMLVVRLDMGKFQQRLEEVKWITPGKPRHTHKPTAAGEGWGHRGQQNSTGSNSSPPDGQTQDSSGEGWVVVTAGARGTGSSSKARSTTSPDAGSKIAASQSWSKAPVRASVSDAEAAHHSVMAVASLNSWEALQLATLAAVGLQMGGTSNRHKVGHTPAKAWHRMDPICLLQACLTLSMTGA
jgi:hypothetical protein